MFKTYEINDSVYLHYLKDNKFKTNTIAILISTKLSEENSTKTALVAQIIKSGCRKYPLQKEIAVKLEEMYGAAFDVSVIKKGNRQCIFIYFEGIESIFEEGEEFLKEIIFYPKYFSGEQFEKAKERLKGEIKAIKDNKGQYAVERMAAEMDNGTYSIPGLGYENEVDNLSGNIMKKYYKELLTRGNIDIYFVGKTDASKARKKMEEIFLHTRSNVWQITEGSLKSKEITPKKIRDEDGLNQGKLCMCFVTEANASKENILALLVLNEIVGDGGNSKLFLKVREKEGLCYSIGSSVNKHKMLMVIEAGINKAEYENVTAIIKKTVEEIKTEITEKDVQSGKISLSKNYMAVFDTPTGIINYGFTNRLLGIIEGPKELADEINSVTVGEVKKLAEKLKCEIEYFLV